MTAPSTIEASPRTGRRLRPKLLISLAVALAFLGFGLANAHLVYVAITTQPECVDHIKERGDVDGLFRAAAPVC